jgi:hypothetical protein
LSAAVSFSVVFILHPPSFGFRLFCYQTLPLQFCCCKTLGFPVAHLTSFFFSSFPFQTGCFSSSPIQPGCFKALPFKPLLLAPLPLKAFGLQPLCFTVLQVDSFFLKTGGEDGTAFGF